LLAYFTGMVADIRPKLRPLDMQWTVLNGRSALVLRDRQGISNRVLLIPGELAPLLAFMDGSRTPTGIRLAFEMRTGRFLPPGLVEGLIAELDEAIFLEGPRLEAARRQALESFRALPIRPRPWPGRSTRLSRKTWPPPWGRTSGRPEPRGWPPGRWGP